jgi:RNA-directed DNA polymerase
VGFTHFCGQRIRDGAFIVWRITAKKRMVAKLKAIKAELQRRKHDRTATVGACLRTVVLGYYQYHAVPWEHDSAAHLGEVREKRGFEKRRAGTSEPLRAAHPCGEPDLCPPS